MPVGNPITQQGRRASPPPILTSEGRRRGSNDGRHCRIRRRRDREALDAVDDGAGSGDDVLGLASNSDGRFVRGIDDRDDRAGGGPAGESAEQLTVGDDGVGDGGCLRGQAATGGAGGEQRAAGNGREERKRAHDMSCDAAGLRSEAAGRWRSLGGRRMGEGQAAGGGGAVGVVTDACCTAGSAARMPASTSWATAAEGFLVAVSASRRRSERCPTAN